MERVIKKWKTAQIREEDFYRKIEGSKEDLQTYERGLRKIWKVFLVDFEFFKGKKVLEVGCGSRGIIHYIDQPCLRIGIDPLCNKYRDIYVKNDFNIPHLTAIGENLPFKNDSFDVVISINSIDHGTNPNESIREIRRVLKQNGLFLLEMDTFLDFPRGVQNLVSLIDRLHLHHLSDKKVLNILSKSGFEIESHSVIKFTIRRVISEFLRSHFISGIKTLFATFLGAQLSYYNCIKSGSSLR